MRYKEFKEKIEDWGQKHDYATKVIFGDFHTNVKVGIDEASFVAAHISNIYTFALETWWNYSTKIKKHARAELFDILVEFAKTPIEDREDKKDNLDLIIHRLEVIQANAEDVMNWTIEEIQERSWNLISTLEDIIIDLEEANKGE